MQPGQEESKEGKERDKRQVSGCNYTTVHGIKIHQSVHKHYFNKYIQQMQYDKNEYCE